MRWPLSTTSNPSFEPLTEALRGLTEGLSPRSTYDCKTMPEKFDLWRAQRAIHKGQFLDQNEDTLDFIHDCFEEITQEWCESSEDDVPGYKVAQVTRALRELMLRHRNAMQSSPSWEDFQKNPQLTCRPVGACSCRDAEDDVLVSWDDLQAAAITVQNEEAEAEN